jgi:tetratricopeptide (TPR) repeat protein
MNPDSSKRVSKLQNRSSRNVLSTVVRPPTPAQTPFFSLIALETLCMKGLVLTHMGRRDEGIDLVKQGMRLDLTSHICWHVFGLIQKGEKNYEEALKSYTQALKFDRVSQEPQLRSTQFSVMITPVTG